MDIDRTNWANPKRLIAVLFFLIAVGCILTTVLVALLGLGSGGCTSTQQAQGACQSSPVAGFLGGGILGAICCLPIALVFFILGAFLWSGAKKDDLRDLEIDSYHRDRKVDKK